jgi:uroporphyrinogen decarboxylase
VDAVQIFDSLGGLLPSDLFEAASGRWMKAIIESLGGQVPVIVFSKGTNHNWGTLLRTGAQVLGVDWTVSLPALRALLPDGIALQGNLDPAILNTSPELVTAETARLLHEMRGSRGHIFNLGHGVPPGAKLENIEALVTIIKNFK